MENDKFPKTAFRWGCCRPEQTPPSPPPVGGRPRLDASYSSHHHELADWERSAESRHPAAALQPRPAG